MTRLTKYVRTLFARPITRPITPKDMARAMRVRPTFEAMEGRAMPASLSAGLAPLVQGVALFRDQAAAIATRGFGQDLPVVNQSLADGLVTAQLRQPLAALATEFAALPTGATADRIAAAATRAGFEPVAIRAAAGPNEELMRFVYSRDLNAGQVAPSFTVGGAPGYGYFNGAAPGELQGVPAARSATQSGALNITLGVDVRTAPNGGETVDFFVAETTATAPTLRLTGVSQGFTINRSKVGVGDLTDTDLIGTATVRVDNATLALANANPNDGGKLRLGDLQPAVAPTLVRADLDGAVVLDADVTTHMLGVGDVSWSGVWTRTYTDGAAPAADPAPAFDVPLTPAAVADGLRNGVVERIRTIPYAGWVIDKLDDKLPFVNKSVAELTGLSDLSGTGNLVPGAAATALRNLGVTVADITAAEAQDLMYGKPITLLSFDVSGGNSGRWDGDLWTFDNPVWAMPEKGVIPPLPNTDAALNTNGTISIPALSLFGLADVKFDFDWALGARYRYQITAGLDTTGFWVGDHTGVQIQGVAQGRLRGSANVLGYSLVSADGTLTVTLDAWARVGDPSPGDSRPFTDSTGAVQDKVYLRELWQPGLTAGETAQNVLDTLDAGVALKLAGYVRVDPPIVSDIYFPEGAPATQWNKRYELVRHEPVPPRNRAQGAEMPAAFAAGTLSLRDSGYGDHVQLEQRAVAADGSATVLVRSVYVDNQGRDQTTQREFSGVRRVSFSGGVGNDKLEVVGGFAVPIDADGGAGDDQLRGGSGNDTLRGGAGNDVVRGGAGNDTLYGDASTPAASGADGNDTLYGGLGDDTLRGGQGSDRLSGEAGNDFLSGEDHADILSGGAGNDTVEGGGGADQVYGDGGTDVLRGDADADTLDGGDDADTVYGGAGDDMARGGGGGDLVRGDAGFDTLTGGDGDDRLEGGTENDLVDGDDGNDSVYGGDGADVLSGGAGNDYLSGGVGNDRLAGDWGRDTVFGDDGDDALTVAFEPIAGTSDVLSGGNDRDTIVVAGGWADEELLVSSPSVGVFQVTSRTITAIHPLTGAVTYDTAGGTRSVSFAAPADAEVVAVSGLGGNDKIAAAAAITRNLLLRGGVGNDWLDGAGGNDSLSGSDGDDTLRGGGGDDELQGDAGADSLSGGDGSDNLYGDAGNDRLSGDAGRDVLRGGADHDRLEAGPGILGDAMYGEAGNDTLVGGDGADILDGGADNDLAFGGGLIDLIDGGAGNDTLAGETGRDIVRGGEGNDELYAFTNDAARTAVGLPALGGTPTVDFNTIYNDIVRMAATVTEEIADLDRRIAATTDVALRLQLGVERQMLIDERSVLHLAAADDPEQRTLVDQVFGEAGDDQLFGSPYYDQINGGEGNDTIYKSGATETAETIYRDTIAGGTGDDTYVVDGTANADTITVGHDATSQLVYVSRAAGERIRVNHAEIEEVSVRALGGNDTVTVQFGTLAPMRVRLDGGAGNDTLDATGCQAQTTLVGGADNDTLRGGNSRDVFDGGAGDDLMISGYSRTDQDVDTYAGGAGTDRLVILGANDATRGDAIRVAGGRLTINARDQTLTPGAFEALEVQGQDGDDVIETDGSVNVTLSGGAGNDSFQVGPGTHVIDGGTGTNGLRVIGTEATDAIRVDSWLGQVRVAGPATVTTTGINGAVVVDARGGHDTVVSSLPRGITVYAGEGNDTVFSGDAGDTVYGEGGDDRLYGYGGNDLLDGGTGADGVYGDGGNDSLWGGAGADTLAGGTGDNWAAGGSENDLMYGDSGVDWLFGEGGNDSVYGYGGNDILYGGDGNDLIRGDAGHDSIYGDGDGDTLYGSAGNDSLFGGSGDDVVYGETDNDYLNGETGNDRCYGGTENDTVHGGEGNDTLTGDDGADFLYGGAGADSLNGGAGNDYLDGGGTGITVLPFLSVAPATDDTLAGGTGADTFVRRDGYQFAGFPPFGSPGRVYYLDSITDLTAWEGDVDLH